MSFANDHLNGAKNGKKIGNRSSIAPNAAKVNAKKLRRTARHEAKNRIYLKNKSIFTLKITFKGFSMPCSNRLFIIFGDQLNRDSLVFQRLNPEQDRLLMAEVLEESIGSHSPSSKQRTVLFFSAMRHFHVWLQSQNYPVDYYSINQQLDSFEAALQKQLSRNPFTKVEAVLPGDERVRRNLVNWCQKQHIALKWLADVHFITQPGEFQDWISNKSQPRMEYWYRYLRKTRNILMNEDGKPLGGKWNFDADNRHSFNNKGPQNLKPRLNFNHQKNLIVQQVIEDVEQYLPQLPGSLFELNWPVNHEQAQEQLAEFIDHHLDLFGRHQDAMWQDQPFLNHSLLSSSLNLKLLSPLEAIKAAEQAYHQKHLPINSVEGFIRQILGWREYVRGLYWIYKSDWQTMNYLQAEKPLPSFYWNADTEMHCLKQSIKQVIDHGYGHHIQRLMVTGLFALLYGVKPEQIEQWYLSMFIDAVAWVEQPNTLAMSQFADGGILASKPYIASGNYINKMSNYCQHCPYNPKQAHGDNACPFTTLYWSFIEKHQALLKNHGRLAMQVKHWQNKTTQERELILQQQEKLYKRLQ